MKKVEKGDIGMGKPGTILVPKVRPYLGKFVLVTNSETYYTRAFLELHPKGVRPETLYACLKHPLVLEQIYRVCTIGKGYPTITSFDLTRLVYVPAVLLAPNVNQLGVVDDKVEQVFNDLSKLSSERSLIDQIINRIFDPNGEGFCTTPIKTYGWRHSQIGLSCDIRLSPHFLNPGSIELLSKIKRLKYVPLSKLCSAPIILGISPDTFVSTSDFYYLGSQAMSTERLDRDKLNPISKEFYERNKRIYGVRRGDVFLRRSGASLGKILYYDSDTPCVFSDFMMRLRPLDPVMGKYLAYWMKTTIFQSLVHRHKILGKGLQNIYPYLVGNLPVPCPSNYNYKRIVDDIEMLLMGNEKVKRSAMVKIGQVQTYLDNEMGFAGLKKEFDALMRF